MFSATANGDGRTNGSNFHSESAAHRPRNDSIPRTERPTLATARLRRPPSVGPGAPIVVDAAATFPLDLLLAHRLGDDYSESEPPIVSVTSPVFGSTTACSGNTVSSSTTPASWIRSKTPSSFSIHSGVR